MGSGSLAWKRGEHLPMRPGSCRSPYPFRILCPRIHVQVSPRLKGVPATSITWRVKGMKFITVDGIRAWHPKWVKMRTQPKLSRSPVGQTLCWDQRGCKLQAHAERLRWRNHCSWEMMSLHWMTEVHWHFRRKITISTMATGASVEPPSS